MQMDASYQTTAAVNVEVCFEKRILMIETTSFIAIVVAQRWTEDKMFSPKTELERLEEEKDETD